MDARGTPESDILAKLETIRSKDFQFAGGRVLASMCTEPHPIARRAYSMFWEANLGNPGLYPGTEELHDELMGMRGGRMGDPAVTGYLVGGGTESNVTALWIAKKYTGRKEKQPNSGTRILNSYPLLWVAVLLRIISCYSLIQN